MTGWVDALRLRVHVGESDRLGAAGAADAIVRMARDAGLAGATVLRGLEGFGEHEEIHSARVLAISSDLPLVVELVDVPERVEAFLLRLETRLDVGTATLEKVRMRRFGVD